MEYTLPASELWVRVSDVFKEAFGFACFVASLKTSLTWSISQLPADNRFCMVQDFAMVFVIELVDL